MSVASRAGSYPVATDGWELTLLAIGIRSRS